MRINLLRAHGSPTGYSYLHRGCRCTICRAEWAQRCRRWLETHPKKDAERKRRYRKTHREAISKRMLRWREENHEHGLEYSRLYRKANPEGVAACCRNRRARKRNAPGTHTAADVLAQYQRQRGRCFWCGAKVPWRKKHTDHVVPIVLRGSNGPENLVIACPACNCSKSAKHPMDFAGVLL